MATAEETAARTAADKAAAASKEADEAAQKAAKAAEDQALADQKELVATQLKTPVIIEGRAGGAFSITGEGFGDSGVLFIGGRVIPTTRWDNMSIRGTLPPGIKGPIRLQTANGDRHGEFPTPKQKTTSTVTIVETSVAPMTLEAAKEAARTQASTTPADKTAADKAAADKMAADKAAADKK